MLKPTVTEKMIEEASKDYLMKYSKYMSDDMINHFHEYYKDGLDSTGVSDFISQFYAEYNFLSDDDLYNEFYEITDSIFNVKDSTILEVGAGRLPVLARIFAKNTSKTVYAMDEKMYPVSYNIENLKLIRKNLVEGMIYQIPDLYVGLLPCEATKTIVKEAMRNQVNFIIAMCPCSQIYNPLYGFFGNPLLNEVNEIIENSNMGELYSTYFKKNFMTTPIIYTKK